MNRSNLDNKRVIHTVNALCGSGKTYQAIRWAIQQALNGERILFVQPTKLLIEQSYQDAMSLPEAKSINVKRIHGDAKNTDQNTIAEIIDYLKQPAPPVGTILFITHQSFTTMKYFHNRSDWTVICDEVLPVFELFEKNLRSNHTLITSVVDAIEYDPNYLVLRRSKDKAKKAIFNRILRNEYDDEAWKIVKPLAEDIASPYKLVLINKELWSTLTGERKKVPNVKLTTHVITRPNIFRGFQRVIIMSALLEETLLYKFWRGKIRFESFNEIESQLQYKLHDNSGKITFKYLIDSHWSKNYYSKEMNGKTILQHCVDALQNELTGKQFLLSVNKNIANPFTNLNSELLPAVPHGMNNFQHIDHLVFLAALNPVPTSFSFCEDQEITSDEVIEGITKQTCYQAMLRSSLRDKDCTRDHLIVVTTKAIAESLSKHFTNFDILPLAGLNLIQNQKPGRPKSKVKRSSTYRMRKARRNPLIQSVLGLNGIDPKGDINPYYINSNSVTHSNKSTLPVTFSKVDTVTVPITEKIVVLNESNLIELMKEWSLRTITCKADNFLFCPSIFKSNQSRKRDNIESCSFLVIDVDGGDMSREDFRAIFPTTRMYIFNTFTAESNRFRVLIPLSLNITPKAYLDIQLSIQARVEKSLMKFKNPKSKTLTEKDLVHGIDLNSRKPEQLYYAPCRANSDKIEDSFFEEHDGLPLCVLGYLKKPYHHQNSAKKFEKEPIELHELSPEEIQAEADELIKIYSKVPAGFKNRRDAFFDLGFRCVCLGLSLEEIETILIKADYDGSRKLKNQINEVLKSLMKPQVQINKGNYQPRESTPNHISVKADYEIMH